jgi:hypothetical protein
MCNNLGRYVDITGCWAASSVADNIWTDPSSNPQLVIVGGTMYAGGGCGDCQITAARRNLLIGNSFETTFHIQLNHFPYSIPAPTAEATAKSLTATASQ